jgi:spore germination cell wall hydrolase CwlJ-like protein
MIAGGALGLAALLALAGVSGATPLLPEFARQADPAEAAPTDAPATAVRPLAPETALAVNARIPIGGTAGPAARPFNFAKASADTRARALECLTSALYYEAGQESDDGQRAVAQVILNRVRHPAFPSSVCGVIYEGSTRVTGCQFTFTCDNSMSRGPIASLWNRSRRIAAEMLGGAVYAPVGHATHYHANYVVPYWASSLVKTDVEGAHIFYRWSGGWGRPDAFGQGWSGREANPAALRMAALSAPHTVITPARSEDAAVKQLEARGVVVTNAKGGRVQVHFTPEAREAVEKVKVTPYIERVSASSNLRYALDGGAPAEAQQAWGKKAETTASAAPAPDATR